MEDEGAEEVEAESEEEVSEAPPKRGRRSLIIVIAVVVVVVLVAGVLAVLLLANSPPQAAFTYASVDLHLTVSARGTTDPDGDSIGAYTWSWGDSTPSSSGSNLVATTHDYAAPNTYTVTLTAVDSRGASSTTSKSVTIIILPTPFFVARQSQMTTSFDASGSYASPGKTIVAYEWAFGDGSTDNSPITSHTYTTPGRYNVTLTVNDTSGQSNVASRYVSANTTTVDILADQFFVSGCPYGGFWGLRYRTYGDVILKDQVPCTDFYPWVLYAKQAGNVNPAWVYTLYHMDIRVAHSLGYNVYQPVVLPVFNYSVAPAANSYIYYNFTFDYLDNSSIDYWGTTAWPVNPKYSDGFGYLVRGNVTMDLQESKRVFGVVASTPAEAQSWWNANTKAGGVAQGTVENKTGAWLDTEGNQKYDIYNGFQWYYESDIADLNATVNPTTGQTTVKVFFDGWGWDVLMSRWFYWGNQSYQKAVNAPWGQYRPQGWMPFETCWCENATVKLSITNAMDLHMSATSEYVFGAIGDPGQDQTYGTSDDLAGWNFAPSLMDYEPQVNSGLQGASSYPNSELKWYNAYTTVVNMPGSYAYGQPFEYMVTPARWNTSLGNTLTLNMPRTPVPWYDPYKSHWDPVRQIGVYSTFTSVMTLRSVDPSQGLAGYYQWDERGKVLSIAWPSGFAWPGANQLPRDSSPSITFGPESTA